MSDRKAPALFDPLLARAALVVEADHILGRPRHVGDDEADASECGSSLAKRSFWSALPLRSFTLTSISGLEELISRSGEFQTAAAEYELQRRELGAFRPHPSEMPGEHDGRHQHAEANRNPFQNHVGTLGHEGPQDGEADREITKSPQDIDYRRRFSNSGRRRERGLKPMAANALNKVRHSVRKEQTADKLQHVNVPRHFGSLQQSRPEGPASLPLGIPFQDFPTQRMPASDATS